MTDWELVQTALAMRELSYCPYSHFAVGAALLGESGRVYTGCNIENAAYSPSCCAERTAFVKAVSEGERRFDSIAVAGGARGQPVQSLCPPCGVCRQEMREFCDPKRFRVLLTDGKTSTAFLLEELLPESFGPTFLSGQDR